MAKSKVRGLDSLKKKLDKIANIDPSKALQAGGFVLQAEIQDNTVPVKTSTLKQSIRTDIISETEVQVSANTNYAFYVEYGTSKWAGHPYMRPAEDNVHDKIIEAVANQIDKDIKDAL